MQLERLKKKSLLESYGDGTDSRSFRMHDLWREFCVVETKCGEIKGRRWVYEKGSCSESSPCEMSPGGNCWEKVKRMAFLEFRSWRGVTFAHFPNVSVLMIKGAKFTEKQVLDLSGLLHLRSLEIFASSVFVQGFPRGLIFLRLDGELVADADGAMAEQVESLKELQCLQLIRYDGCKLPNVASMSSLLMASFSLCRNVVALNGLSSTLRILLLNDCYELRSCVGVGNLVALEEFLCNNCLKLEGLPNLGKLRRLRILEIGWCGLITEVPGLGDLKALEELRATECENLLRLSDMHRLVNLRVLELEGCESVTEMPGVDRLISLEVVEADFRAMEDMPNLGQLTKLRKAFIDGWNSAGVQELSNLKMLRILRIGYCTGADKLPDLRNLTLLQEVTIESSEFKDVCGLSHSSALESLWIYECANLERLPLCRRLASLRSLKIADCPELIWDSMAVPEQVEGKFKSPLEDDGVCGDVPSTELEWNLETLELSDCGSYDLRTFGSFPQLESLYIQYSAVTELPDLSDLPRLRTLEVWNCERFQRLLTSAPTQSLRTLDLDGCGSLSTLPDLSKEFPGLLTLVLRRCHGITSLNTNRPMTALTTLIVDSCNSLTAVPDLAMFAELEKLKVEGSSELKELSSSEPLLALRGFTVKSCTALTTVPNLAMFPALEALDLNGCSELQALSNSVALAALTKLEVMSCQAVMAVPDLGKFPTLKNLDVHGCSKLKELSSGEPLFALRSFKVKSCTALTTVLDLAMFVALEALDLNGCSELEALSDTMPLALRKVDIRGCDRLSRDHVALLRKSCPQCEIQWD